MIERSSSRHFLHKPRLDSIYSRRSTIALATSLLLSLTLGACVRESSSTDDDEPDADGDEGGIELSGPPVLGPVIWATSVDPGTNEPETQVTKVPDDAQVFYAVFPVERLAGGTLLDASWTFNGEPLEGLGAEIEASRDQVGGWLEFHLERTSSERWPDGNYGISLTTDGVLVATGGVQVMRSGDEQSAVLDAE